MDIKETLEDLRRSIMLSTLPILITEVSYIEKSGYIRTEKFPQRASVLFRLKTKDGRMYDDEAAADLQQRQLEEGSRLYVQLVWDNLTGSGLLGDFQAKVNDHRSLEELKEPKERMSWANKALAYAKLDSLQMQEYMEAVQLHYPGENVGMHKKRSKEKEAKR